MCKVSDKKMGGGQKLADPKSVAEIIDSLFKDDDRKWLLEDPNKKVVDPRTPGKLEDPRDPGNNADPRVPAWRAL